MNRLRTSGSVSGTVGTGVPGGVFGCGTAMPLLA